jgi:hypothetical protein
MWNKISVHLRPPKATTPPLRRPTATPSAPFATLRPKKNAAHLFFAATTAAELPHGPHHDGLLPVRRGRHLALRRPGRRACPLRHLHLPRHLRRHREGHPHLLRHLRGIQPPAATSFVVNSLPLVILKVVTLDLQVHSPPLTTGL